MSIANAPGERPLTGLTVAVVGAGRIGAEIIRNLRLMGIGRVDAFECDRRAAASLRGRCTVYEGDFWDTLTLSRLQQYDFAVCTIAARAARRRLNSKCVLANVNLMQVAIAGTLVQVDAYPFALRSDSACAECDTSAATAVALPIASLRLSVGDIPARAVADSVATASAAGAVTAALMARIAAGAHGAVARTATLDAALGEGRSRELHRDPQCPVCAGLQRPVPIVTTRNRWDISSAVAQAYPDVLDQRLQLSDDIDGLSPESCCLRELAERFQGGPIPAKFALTAIGGRTICLAFEDCVTGPTSRTAGSQSDE